MKYFKLDNIENWGSAIPHRNDGGDDDDGRGRGGIVVVVATVLVLSILLTMQWRHIELKQVSKAGGKITGQFFSDFLHFFFYWLLAIALTLSSPLFEFMSHFLL